jgi:hypothetical protein
MDSNYSYRGTKAQDFRGIPGTLFVPPTKAKHHLPRCHGYLTHDSSLAEWSSHGRRRRQRDDIRVAVAPLRRPAPFPIVTRFYRREKHLSREVARRGREAPRT